MSLAAFVAAQRTDYGVPHAVACRALDISQSWFYKWRDRPPSERRERRVLLDAAVAASFRESGDSYGSPRIFDDLIAEGWTVSVNTVAESMVRQGLVARSKKRRKNLTRPDKSKRPFPDLLRRDFTAAAPDVRWVGDMTEIATDGGKLYLATVIDLFSRRLLGYATSCHPDAELAADAIRMAAATRGGQVTGVVFHSDRGSTYTANDFTALCRQLGIVQSMGRVGSCFDNAAAESFFSTLEHEVQSRHHFMTRAQAQTTIVSWVVDFYNSRRRHSSAGRKSPIDFEALYANMEAA